MSFNYDRYDTRTNRRFFSSTSSSHRSGFGYWVPLIITVTAATAALGAWVWNERKEGSEEEDEYIYEHEFEHDTEEDEARVKEERRKWREEHGETSVYTDEHTMSGAVGGGGGEADYYTQASEAARTDAGGPPPAEGSDSFIAQMRGALGRTPSPQQLVSGAKSTFNAGVAAVGRGLNSIREGEDEHGVYFEDQERWSEEAASRERTDDTRRDIGALGAAAAAGSDFVGTGASTVGGYEALAKTSNSQGRVRSRMVAIVVSADAQESQYADNNETSYSVEHTSILSHLIGHFNSDNNIQLLILIYAPHLEKHPLAPGPTDSNTNASRATSKSRRTSNGSYDKLSDNPQDVSELRAQLPLPLDDQDDSNGAEGQIISSYTSSSSPVLYNALATQAATLVSHPTHILPFTTPTGHVHMLKHLAPSLVYVQESLCGDRGQIVKDIGGWVGSCVVVVGAEGAGLVDTETEDEGVKKDSEQRRAKWWQDERVVGLGKGVEVVEGMKLGADWAKRVEGQ